MEKVRLEICHGAEFFRLEPLLVEVAAEVEFSFLSTERIKKCKKLNGKLTFVRTILILKSFQKQN